MMRTVMVKRRRPTGRFAALALLVAVVACATPEDGIYDVRGRFVGPADFSRIPDGASRIAVAGGDSPIAYHLAKSLPDRYREIAVLPDGFIDYSRAFPPNGITTAGIGSAEGALPAAFAGDRVAAERIAAGPRATLQAPYGTVHYVAHRGDDRACLYFTSIFGPGRAGTMIGNQSIAGQRCRPTVEPAQADAFIDETLDMVERLRFD